MLTALTFCKVSFDSATHPQSLKIQSNFKILQFIGPRNSLIIAEEKPI